MTAPVSAVEAQNQIAAETITAASSVTINDQEIGLTEAADSYVLVPNEKEGTVAVVTCTEPIVTVKDSLFRSADQEALATVSTDVTINTYTQEQIDTYAVDWLERTDQAVESGKLRLQLTVSYTLSGTYDTQLHLGMASGSYTRLSSGFSVSYQEILVDIGGPYTYNGKQVWGYEKVWRDTSSNTSMYQSLMPVGGYVEVTIPDSGVIYKVSATNGVYCQVAMDFS